MRQRLLILCWHNVEGTDAFPALPGIGTTGITRQLVFLRRFANVVSLRDGVAQLRTGRGLPSRAVAITFDDGYRDNLDIAVPILRRLGLPATFFLTPEFLDGRTPWWETLAWTLRCSPSTELTWRGERLSLADADLRSTTETLTRDIKAMDEGARSASVADLSAELSVAGGRLESPMMSWEDATRLVRMGFAIGSHSTRHSILANENAAAQRADLIDARLRLQERLTNSVEILAYPNGRLEDYNLTTVVAAEGAGHVAALTTTPGLNDYRTYPMTLKRFVMDPAAGLLGFTEIPRFYARQARASLRNPGQRAESPATASGKIGRPMPTRRRRMHAGEKQTGGGDALRLLILIDSLGLGGAESLLVPFIGAARRSGVAVKVAVLSGRSFLRNDMVDSVRAAGVEPHFLGIERLLDPRAIPRLARYLRTSDCDVVHAHLGYSITLGAPAARLARRPMVATFHHVPSPLPAAEAVKERLSVTAASTSAACIFVSDAQRAAFAALYPRRTGRWIVIRNGVDLEAFRGIEATFPPELEIPQGSPVVIIVGALRRPKGQHRAIAAWELVCARHPSARLLLVGSGPEERNLRQDVQARGLGASVIFAGFRRDIPRLLTASTLMVSASETEALPTVVMEAGAASLPVVATSVGGTNEVIDDGVTGVLVPPDRPDLLGQAVAELLADPSTLAAMADAAGRRARAEFGAGTWVDRLGELYDQARGITSGAGAGCG